MLIICEICKKPSDHSVTFRVNGGEIEHHCLKCHAEYYKKLMRETGKAILYHNMCKDPGFNTTDIRLMDWPESFSIPVSLVNFRPRANKVYVYFNFENERWIGIGPLGNGTYLKCRKLKGKK